MGDDSAPLPQMEGITDLNTLIPAGSPWYLQAALSINDAGEIVGYGLINGNVHGYLAIPIE